MILPFKRTADFAIAAVIAVLVIAISPIGIWIATGRLDFSPRVTIPILTLDLFLLILLGAVLASGRVRRVFFHLLAWTIPLALLAAIEGGAAAIHLADRLMPLEDCSVLVHKYDWSPHAMEGRKAMIDGMLLHRPWQGDGIRINELGLRTALPSPKSPGEWRIAVTGGSAAWGWHMRDADTIPIQLQQILHLKGYPNLAVYNFAIESITIAEELAVLKRFRELYAIDQVVFYTGANDAWFSYWSPARGPPLRGATAFELIKVAGRLNTMLVGPSPSLIARLDNDVLPKLAQHNSLRGGVVAADQYCRMLRMRCDFILQPTLLTRNKPRGPEVAVTRSLNQVYPRYGEVIATTYRTTADTGLSVHDFSDLFADSAEPYFCDAVHVNEVGNRLAAERIAATIARDQGIK